MGRHDTFRWDGLAIREAVVNAVVHNNYVYGTPPKIELFSDHMEITSVGTIPEGLSKEDFFNGVSMPRNKELMRVFRDVEMVEALGSGMIRIMRSYGRDNFEFGDNYIRFRASYNVLDNVTVNITEKELQLTERQVEVLKLLTVTAERNVLENVLENSASLGARLMVSERTIRRDLSKLQELGYIRHVGPDKGGRWQVLRILGN